MTSCGKVLPYSTYLAHEGACGKIAVRTQEVTRQDAVVLCACSPIFLTCAPILAASYFFCKGTDHLENEESHVEWEGDCSKTADCFCAVVLIAPLSEVVKSARMCWGICYPETILKNYEAVAQSTKPQDLTATR